MKTLHNETIVYDDECPMCAVYTGAFVRFNFLDKNGRQPYREIVSAQNNLLDIDRARNEIALVNSRTRTVTYGLDSLIKILSFRWPWIRTLFSWRPLYRCVNGLYKFISYNRKVIAPSAVFEVKNSCTPDFHAGWRWAYIVFAWVLTSIILTAYSGLLAPFLEPGNVGREFIVCGIQIAWQGIIVITICRERVLHYLGNMMTISLAGALALLPAFVLQLKGADSLVALVYFFIVVGLMFLEHIRRVRILELPWYITATWIVYRVIVLIILL